MFLVLCNLSGKVALVLAFASAFSLKKSFRGRERKKVILFLRLVILTSCTSWIQLEDCMTKHHNRSKQRTDQTVLVLTLKLLALTKSGFPPVKNTSKFFFDFCLPLFYATFQCEPYNIFRKNLNYFFAHENLRKTGLKSCS